MPADTTLETAIATIATLEEAIADLQQLALEDRGWDRLLAGAQDDLTPEGRRRIGDMCNVMTIANPLIKRGFQLRLAYVWGAGCEQTVKPGDTDREGRLPALVDEIWSEPRNTDALASEQARESLERWLYTRGAVVLLLHTPTTTAGKPTGDLIVRQEDPNHITDRITDPDDATRVWYWQRSYKTRQLRADGTPGQTKTVTVWHPDIDYHPTGPERLPRIGKHEVRWDQPLLVVSVNQPASATEVWGFPDAYAAIPWARMSKEFLEAWYTLMRALARFAWKTTSATGAGKKLMDRARQAQAAAAAPLDDPARAGGHAVMDAGTTLEAIPKTGATIDAASGQPLQQMVAAALDVPLTMLLTDPGVSGARAVAETLDQPMELAMGARRRLWGAIFGRIAWHKIATAIEAGTAQIPGADVTYRDGQRTVILPDGWAPIISTEWPDYDSVPVDVLLKALRDADGLDVLPPELVARLVMTALRVKDPEEWLEKMRDEHGNLLPASVWLDRTLAAGEERGEGA